MLGALAVAAAGVAAAWAGAWVCDDAFVSFRYADHLVRGHGLVFNPGERVEGYTNLSWTLAVAGAMALGFDPVPASLLLGIACFAALLGLLLFASPFRPRGPGGAYLPLAAVLLASLGDARTWATSGLETPLFALLALASVLAGLGRRGWRGPAASGLLVGLAMLTRPDGLLFAAPGAWLAWRGGGERLRRLVAFALPLAALVGGLVAFKLAYYGELLPTSYWAKSPGRAWYSQGLLYVGLFLVRNWQLVPLAVLLGWAGRRRCGAGDDDSNLVWIFAGTGALFVAYVVHSGGDFMFARRLIPTLPFFFLALEGLAVRGLSLRGQAAVALAAVACALAPIQLFGPERTRIRGIADEPSFYPPEAIAARREQAEAVGRALRGTPARVLIEGGMCVFAYYSRLPYVVEYTGLTQYSLARLPLAERGLVGHEKAPTDDWLRAHDIHLRMSQTFPPVAPEPGRRPHDQVYFGTLARARILRWSHEVMDPLVADPAVSAIPIENVVEQIGARIAAADKPEAERLFRYIDGYYFAANRERTAEQAARLQALVEAAGGF